MNIIFSQPSASDQLQKLKVLIFFVLFCSNLHVLFLYFKRRPNFFGEMRFYRLGERPSCLRETLPAGSRSTCRAAAAPSRPRTWRCASALASKSRPAWSSTPCCRRAGANRKRSISCPTSAAPPSRPSSWCTTASSRSVPERAGNGGLESGTLTYLSSPAGGRKWSPPAGIQAQSPVKQRRHVFRVRESPGARHRLRPKLSRSSGTGQMLLCLRDI